MRIPLSAAGIALVFLGCGIGRVDRVEGAADLVALLPTLSAYRVTNFYRTDKCEYIAYAHGVFVTDPESPDCDVDIEGPYPRALVDAQARSDLDAIYAESERLGQRLQAAFIQYGADGSVVGGAFGFEWERSFIYEPAWTSLPAEDSDEVTAINSDWYEVTYGD